MRKTFLTFCTAALALLAVSSCGKIWDEFDNVQGQIDDLKAKLEALEAKLNSEVATLNDRLGGVQDAFAKADADLKAALEAKITALDGKLADEISSLRSELDALDGAIDGKLNSKEEEIVAAIEELTTSLNTKYEELKGVDAQVAAALVELGVTKVVKNADGNAVITFADGTELEVATDANVNNEGLVTVVDGKWAVIGADGETTVLDAEVHPDTKLTFKVDLDTKELLYSLDGETYEKTGAFVSDEQFSIVNGVVEGEDYVTITIGGVEYNLPKVSANVFQIQSGKAFFTAGETKTFKVKSVGMVSSFLANSPKGWDVTVSNSEIVVTAPAEDAEGAAEGGVIEIWVLTDNGTTLLGTLAVTLQEAPFTLTVDGENVTLNVTGLTVNIEDEYGAYEAVLMDVVFGACPVDQYNPQAILDAMSQCGWAQAPEGAFNNYVGWDFVNTVETTIPELLGGEFVPGSYVVWAILRGYDAGLQLTTADFVLEYINKISVEVEATPSWNDISFSVDVKGAEESFAMVMPKEMYEGYAAEYWSEEGLANWESMGFGFEQLFFPGMLHYSPFKYFEGSFSDKITTFGAEEEDGYMTEVAPGSDWVILVLPLTKDNKNDYRLSDVTVYEVSAEELLPNGSAVVTFGDNAVAAYDRLTVPASTTGEVVYYYAFSADELVDYGLDNDDAILDYLLDNEVYMTGEAEFDMIFNSLSLGTEYTVAALAIDSEGKYGQLAKATYSTKALPYDTAGALSVSVASVEFSADNAKQVTVTYEVSGASKLAVYGGTSGAACAYSTAAATVSNWELKLLTQPGHYQLSKHDVVDGKVTITYNNYSTSGYYAYKYVYFTAYNVDEAGNVTVMTETQVVDLSTYAEVAE